jgi:hypothetical protein
MSRTTGLGLVLVALSCTPCVGQEWASKMFKVTDHDFGSVAAWAKAEYAFVLENIYVEDVHIAAVRTSCGCTTPRIENATLKTYEKGAIVAHFNTDKFTAQRGATLTVTIDRPFYAEVQLQVHGYIRSDVVFDPGSIEVGSVDQGVAVEKTVAVNYAGRDDWKILSVKSSNPHISARAFETVRNSGQVSYALKVLLDKKAPAGYINDQLIVMTDDARISQIPVSVEGRVLPGITVSPATLFMGVVQPGQKVTKQLLVTGKTPFKILGITCDDKSFRFDISKQDSANKRHLIPVTFSASAGAGQVVKTIRIKTDQGEMAPELSAYAEVASAQ